MKRIILQSTSIPFGSRCPFKEKTGISYYDEFLTDEGLKYMQSHKNRTGEIVMMSPNEYYKECADNLFTGSSVQSLKEQRRATPGTVDTYVQDMKSGDKFPLPYINYADSGQEGLHRMMAAGDAFGWDTKFPVLVVTAIDDHLEELKKIRRYWNDAVYEAKQFRYHEKSWKHDIVEEIQYELDAEDVGDYHVVISDEDESYISVVLKEFEDIMNPMIIYEPEFLDESDIDESDIDEAIYNLDDDEILNSL